MIQAAPADEKPSIVEPIEPCAVGQLQLMRLVRQVSAIAGWLIYPHPLLNPASHQRQALKAVVRSLTPEQEALCHVWVAEEFLHGLERDEKELQPDVWWFEYVPSASPATLIYGLRFRELLSRQWAYVLLWGNCSAAALEPQQLALEVDVFQQAIALDRQRDRLLKKVEYCKQVLRRIEHQVRHPLAVIHLYASNLYRSLSQEPERLQVVAIRDAVRHLSDHLADMLAGCQRTHIQSEMCDMLSLLEDVGQGLQLLVQDKQVHLVWPTQPLQMMGDRAQLMQLFENLLHNALCFSPQHGQISIHWQRFHREVLITIADQGPGLTPVDLQHLFQAHYSNRPQGTGLGLAIAHQIVQDHGGQIWADNLPNGGAQFSIAFPLPSPISSPTSTKHDA
ncbi:sensor histidine kinase [Leptolyngbya sp. AN02str]|uniref:sensor histidine kinase n=1 Tax=Leptolyngbya sp. AN02str TaxID=3423363 RepID=UPI003D31C83B